MNEVQGLLEFVNRAPTCYHAIAEAEKLLEGFTRLEEGQPWQLAPGGRYVVTRNRSSLIAFVLPDGEDAKPERLAFRLVASHSDSPMFRVKENAELTVKDKYVQLDVEKYGGMLFAPWYDRPLSIAGRVLVRTPEGISTRLCTLDRDMAIIPNVAIHMNREVNSGYKYQPHIDLMPLWGTGAAKGSFKRVIAESVGAREEDILGSDLFLVSRVPGRVWGEEEAYLSAARLDDLECVYTSLMALTAAAPASGVRMACVFDNEEVGSRTKQGADSTFLADTLRRIVTALGGAEEQLMTALASSFMLSADNAHAVHPNHPELSDPVNQVWMNEGVVVKFNANQKYTTDGLSQAVFAEICRREGVPVQYFANRSDMAGGGTLGNISTAHVSINTVDIGLAQLAMHSCYETAGTRDVPLMIRAMRAFYETPLRCKADGEWVF